MEDKNDLDFKPVEAEDIDRLTPLFCRRPNKTCDSVFLDSFIWSKLYGVQFAVSDGKAIQWLMENDGVAGTAHALSAVRKIWNIISMRSWNTLIPY